MPCDGSITALSNSADGVVWGLSCCDDPRARRGGVGYLDMRRKLIPAATFSTYYVGFVSPSRALTELSGGFPIDPMPSGPIVVSGTPVGGDTKTDPIPPDINED
jgi:hypothetical protein